MALPARPCAAQAWRRGAPGRRGSLAHDDRARRHGAVHRAGVLATRDEHWRVTPVGCVATMPLWRANDAGTPLVLDGPGPDGLTLPAEPSHSSRIQREGDEAAISQGAAGRAGRGRLGPGDRPRRACLARVAARAARGQGSEPRWGVRPGGAEGRRGSGLRARSGAAGVGRRAARPSPAAKPGSRAGGPAVVLPGAPRGMSRNGRRRRGAGDRGAQTQEARTR